MGSYAGTSVTRCLQRGVEHYAALRSQRPLLDIVVVTLVLRKLFLHERQVELSQRWQDELGRAAVPTARSGRQDSTDPMA
jgi:hypothetical protein